MAAHQNIRIRLKAFDHRILDNSTHEIVNTVDHQGEILDKLNEEMNETRKDISKAYLLMMKHKGGSFIFD